MSKVLLVAVNARYSHTNLAVRSIVTYCRAGNRDAAIRTGLDFAEFNINQRHDQILNSLYEEQADIYLFSVYIWNRRIVLDLIDDLKKIRPTAVIGLGGPEVSYTAAETLASIPACDLVFRGEGERAVLNLIEACQFTEPITLQTLFGSDAPLDGICLRDPQSLEPVLSPPADPVDLDSIPFPYPDGFSTLQHQSVYYESSRGCPYNCIYCLSSAEDHLRFRSLPLVFNDIDQMLEGGVNMVRFIDRSFNCDRQRARLIWSYLIENDLARKASGLSRTRWHFEIAAHLLEPEDFILLKKAPAGLFHFEIGVQSTNDEVLRRSGRLANTADILEAIRRLTAGGTIDVHADLICGLPGEDLPSVLRSIDMCASLGQYTLQIGFLKLLPGTKMLQYAKEHGYVWQKEPPYEVLQSDGLKYGELRYLKNIEVIFERYANSHRFPHIWSSLLSIRPSISRTAADIASYWKKNGLFDRSVGQDTCFLALHGWIIGHDRLSDSEKKALSEALEEDYTALRGRHPSWQTFLQSAK